MFSSAVRPQNAIARFLTTVDEIIQESSRWVSRRLRSSGGPELQPFERLEHRAEDAASYHGHVLDGWHSLDGLHEFSTCRACGSRAVIGRTPLLHREEFVGAAIQCNCPAEYLN